MRQSEVYRDGVFRPSYHCDPSKPNLKVQLAAKLVALKRYVASKRKIYVGFNAA